MSEMDDRLRRIETLIAGLESGEDSQSRRLARELLEVVLDLHGLALARLAAIVAAAPDGPGLLARSAEDPHVRAVLLLHGLHPEEPAERVARAVAALNEELGGTPVRVLAVTAASVRLSVRHDGAEPAALRQQIEAAVVDAAPELEELVIEGLDPTGAEAWPALTG